MADQSSCDLHPHTDVIVDNGVSGVPDLTIAVPTYRDDARPLIARLAGLAGADRCALIVYDDGSGMAPLIQAQSEAIRSFPGPARLVSGAVNIGRSAARNRLMQLSQSDWILFLDADMLPDHGDFLTRYLAERDRAERPALIAGGFTVAQITPSKRQRLHYSQAALSDSVSAADRARDPGRFVYSSNILAHRSILQTIAFDESFKGWGWEDVDWGLRVAAAHPVHHIDNTATHLGLDDDAILLAKFGSSGENFAHLVRKHPAAAESMPLLRAARAMKPLAWSAPLAKSVALQTALPDRIRVTALKLYRAAMYSRYL